MENFRKEINKYTYSEILNNGEKEELQARYDSRQSFYKKAHVITYKNIQFLLSYNTIVAAIKGDLAYIWGYYSNTTGRHINEFLYQNGFDKMSKKEIENSDIIIKG